MHTCVANAMQLQCKCGEKGDMQNSIQMHDVGCGGDGDVMGSSGGYGGRGGRGGVRLELVEVVVVVVQEHASLGLRFTCQTRPSSKKLGLDYVLRHCLRYMSMSCLLDRYEYMSFRDNAG